MYIRNKNIANGFCGVCNNEVPEESLNKFYCSESCRIQAWSYFHPDEEEPDWDSLPYVIYY